MSRVGKYESGECCSLAFQCRRGPAPARYIILIAGKRGEVGEVRVSGASPPGPVSNNDSYLVDPASSHMLVSKIKPCMSKFTLLIR